MCCPQGPAAALLWVEPGGHLPAVTGPARQVCQLNAVDEPRRAAALAVVADHQGQQLANVRGFQAAL